jgi:hypothetical protein
MVSTIFNLEWIYIERCLDDLTFNPISSSYQPPHPILYVHIVVIASRQYKSTACFFFFFLQLPFSMSKMCISGGAQTHLDAASTHFEALYAGLGLVVDNTLAQSCMTGPKVCLSIIHFFQEKMDQAKGR